MKSIVVALGGNAIARANEKGTNEEQFGNVDKTTYFLAQLVRKGYRLTIVHGNGPQVGNLLIQHNSAKDKVPALPMDVCGAQSQGQIGYMIQQTLINHLKDPQRSVVSLVTQVEVDPEDKAFKDPSKPVGPFYGREEGEALREQGLSVIEDAGRGYRRVVPSPLPLDIVELKAIKELLEKDAIVICGGGGGIPVVKRDGGYVGVEAVIDKDLAAELIATKIKAEVLLILTDIEKVALNYHKPDQVFLDKMTIKEAEKYSSEGHFAKGSMAPKVQAAMNFVKNGGERAIITELSKVMEALEGKTGTEITMYPAKSGPVLRI